MGKSAEMQFSSRQPGGEVALQGRELCLESLFQRGFSRWPRCGVGCLKVLQVGGNNPGGEMGPGGH